MTATQSACFLQGRCFFRISIRYHLHNEDCLPLFSNNPLALAAHSGKLLFVHLHLRHSPPVSYKDIAPVASLSGAISIIKTDCIGSPIPLLPCLHTLADCCSSISSCYLPMCIYSYLPSMFVLKYDFKRIKYFLCGRYYRRVSFLFS